MSQFAFVYSPSYAGNEAWLAQREIIRVAVTHLTRKEVQDALDISKTTLSETLDGKRDHRWAAEWTHILKAMLAQRYDDVSIELLRKLCEHDMTVTPLTVSEPRGLTPEQERDEYRKELARTEEGKAAIARVQAKGKRK